MPEMQLPNLDYAFLADFAKVTPNGTLTAVGASFTQVVAGALPTAQLVSVAGRVRMADDSGPIALTVKFVGPEEAAPTVETTMMLRAGEMRPYEGRVGVLFSLTTIVPISTAGLHKVTIELDGQEVRMLAFSVAPASASR